MAFRNELHNLQIRNLIKSIIIGLLGLFLLILIVILFTYPSRLRIDLPPDLSQAQSIKPGYIYPSTAHQFASTFFQYVNTWKNSGDEDYRNRRNEIRAYITQNFYDALKKDFERKLAQGELKGRTRQIELAEGSIYKPELVVSRDGYWIATVRFNIIERFFDQVVKDVQIEYKIIVVRHNVDPSLNSYQLALDGFAESPKIIKRIK